MPFTCFFSHSDEGRSNSAGVFVGGFVLGGIIVGTLGCVYAPQVVIYANDHRKDCAQCPSTMSSSIERVEWNKRWVVNAFLLRLSSTIRSQINDHRTTVNSQKRIQCWRSNSLFLSLGIFVLYDSRVKQASEILHLMFIDRSARLQLVLQLTERIL